MNTTAITAASGTKAGTTGAAANPNEASDRFLKLLVTQMQNQDPLNPMDNAEVTSQMAQINTVTGIQQVNETLKNMAEQFTAMQVLQGSSMVGHNVLVEGNALTRIDGVASGAVELAGATDAVKLEILSPGGVVLETFNMGALPAGRHPFNWDASGYKGTGEPSFRVTASAGGKAVASTSFAQDKVVSVGSDNGALSVQLQGRGAVAYSSVKAIL